MSNNVNNTKNAEQKKGFCFTIKTGKQIQDAEIAETEYLVDGIITPGLNLLSAPRKRGKSWMALNMAICVAGDKDFLGLKTEHGKVLYFALEDTEDRMQKRMNAILDDADSPEDLLISFSIGHTGNDFFNDLDGFLNTNSDIKLVIIDVLQKVRMDRKSNQTEYSHDYKECGRLKDIADKHGISMLVVHHNRKTKDKADPINNIAGGVGVTGASDTIIMLSGGTLGKQNTLSIVSRDMPDQKVAVIFDTKSCIWKYLGTKEELDIKKDEEEYAASPAIRAVKKLLEDATSWHGTISELLETSKGLTDGIEGLSASALARKINKFDDLLLKDGIEHVRPNPNGGIAGRQHIFVKKDRIPTPPPAHDEGGAAPVELSQLADLQSILTLSMDETDETEESE